MKFGCAICIFLNSENLICRSTDISRSVSVGPFNFEITRVDCIVTVPHGTEFHTAFPNSERAIKNIKI